MRARLDTCLVRLGLAASRENAQRLILAGCVRVNGETARKPSDKVSETASIHVVATERFVGRGGYKLEAALTAFGISCAGAVCLDIGASTGGFTDCLLQHGARRVHAVDVGKGQLAWRLCTDPRVIVHDGLNARYLGFEDIGETVDLVAIDVSFISLTKVLPAAVGLLKSGGVVVSLIKPQFEAGRKDVKKGGVVRDYSVHERVKTQVARFALDALGLQALGEMIESPLLGPAGNKEFLAAWRKP